MSIGVTDECGAGEERRRCVGLDDVCHFLGQQIPHTLPIGLTPLVRHPCFIIQNLQIPDLRIARIWMHILTFHAQILVIRENQKSPGH